MIAKFQYNKEYNKHVHARTNFPRNPPRNLPKNPPLALEDLATAHRSPRQIMTNRQEGKKGKKDKRAEMTNVDKQIEMKKEKRT